MDGNQAGGLGEACSSSTPLGIFGQQGRGRGKVRNKGMTKSLHQLTLHSPVQSLSIYVVFAFFNLNRI